MSKSEVDNNEKEAFLTWRRGFVALEENYDMALTPFEKNLEFWRQLWRVVEKSDVVVQVVDARNPLLYMSQSLQDYVKEVGSAKNNVILFNKADLLPKKVRAAWGKFLDAQNVRCFFFAARTEIEARLKEKEAEIRKAMIPEGNEDEEEDAEKPQEHGATEASAASLDELEEGDERHDEEAARAQGDKAQVTLDGSEVRFDAMGRVIIEDIDDVSVNETAASVDQHGRKRNSTDVLNASDLLDELEALGWQASSGQSSVLRQQLASSPPLPPPHNHLPLLLLPLTPGGQPRAQHGVQPQPQHLHHRGGGEPEGRGREGAPARGQAEPRGPRGQRATVQDGRPGRPPPRLLEVHEDWPPVGRRL
jgi:hypothetical protein